MVLRDAGSAFFFVFERGSAEGGFGGLNAAAAVLLAASSSLFLEQPIHKCMQKKRDGAAASTSGFRSPDGCEGIAVPACLPLEYELGARPPSCMRFELHARASSRDTPSATCCVRGPP